MTRVSATGILLDLAYDPHGLHACEDDDAQESYRTERYGTRVRERGFVDKGKLPRQPTMADGR